MPAISAREQQAIANAFVTPLAVSNALKILVQLGAAAQLQNAANDAAAAALNPPVPVDGLYRNGSVVMIRVS